MLFVAYYCAVYKVDFNSLFLKENNEANRKLHQLIQAERKFLITPAQLNGMLFLRVSTGMNDCTNDVLEKFWVYLQSKATSFF